MWGRCLTGQRAECSQAAELKSDAKAKRTGAVGGHREEGGTRGWGGGEMLAIAAQCVARAAGHGLHGGRDERGWWR